MPYTLSSAKVRDSQTFLTADAPTWYQRRHVAAKPKENAVARLKARISARLDADKDKPRNYRKTQAGLAAALKISKGSLNEALNGNASKRGLLFHLDGIAAYFGVPPSLLVHANDTSLIELQQGEWRLVQHWRRLPPEAQESVLLLFDYFAGLLPEEKEQRRLYQLWRRLTRLEQENFEKTLRDQLRGRPSRRGQDTGSAAPESSDGTPGATGTRE